MLPIVSRRSLLLGLINFNEKTTTMDKQYRPISSTSTPSVSKSEYLSKSETFKLTTLVKDDENMVSVRFLTKWYDPFTRRMKKDEENCLYFLSPEGEA